MPPKLEDLQQIPNAVLPTPGQGLTLDHNGVLPPTVLAPSPADNQALTYDAATNASVWEAVSAVPAGAVTSYGGSSAPTGWLLCDGASLLRTDYAALFTAIGTTYGSADGTHFNVPDLRGRVAVGKGSNADVSALANSDGVAEANRRPKHRHTAHSHTLSIRNSGVQGAAAGIAMENAGSTTTSSVDGGSGTASDSLDAPAYLVLNSIIKT